MALISYPRSSGAKEDIKRAEAAIDLIESLLSNFNPNDLRTVMSIVGRIGWERLPKALKDKLLSLLFYSLYYEVVSQADAKILNRADVSSVSLQLVDIAVSASNNIELSLDERISQGTPLSVSQMTKNDKSRYQADVLLFNNGMKVVISADKNSQFNHSTTLRRLINSQSASNKQDIKQAQRHGTLVTYNPLKQYEDVAGQSSLDRTQYELDKIPQGLLHHSSISLAILASENRPLATYSANKRKPITGKQFEHIIPHSALTQRSKLPNETRAQIPLINGAGDYTEGRAPTYPVHDGQGAGTEHRELTIKEVMIARQFIKEGREGTLSEWINEIEKATIDMFTNALIRDDTGQQTRQYPLEGAKVMASAIKLETIKHYERLGVPMSIKLSNRIASMRIPATSNRIAKKGF